MVDEMLIGAVALWPKVRYIVDCFLAYLLYWFNFVVPFGHIPLGVH